MPRRSPVPIATARRSLWRAALAVAAVLAVAALVFVVNRREQPADVATSPSINRHVYSESADPRADISAALAEAGREHKRVLLDFGGDWCGDCLVLDYYLHQEPNADLLAGRFVLVHVWISNMDANLDVASRYGVPIAKGVPALAVLDASGATLYSQQTGQFDRMRSMRPSAVTDFLNEWKG
jgi:thiol:disulfide interchange protein